MAGMIVEVSARTFTIPYECPCCGAAPDTEIVIPVERGKAGSSARGLDFPYCRRCLGHAHAWETAGVASAGVMVGGLLAGVIAALAIHPVAGGVVFAAAIPLAWFLATTRRARARAGCGPSCASPGKALAYLGWSGRATAFAFESPTYAARFAEANPRTLVDASPQLKQLLEGHRVARLAVPTPAAAVSAVPPAATVAEWIARIEGSRGPVERRHTLQRALGAVHDAEGRGELLRTTSRLELASILRRLESVSEPSAHQALVRQALDDVRTDNLPDDLRAVVLQELEARVVR